MFPAAAALAAPSEASSRRKIRKPTAPATHRREVPEILPSDLLKI
jgi:hypothetical protein